MNIYLRLIYEFFKIGLFSIGGGMATLPFLAHLGENTGWFSYADLMNMLAVSESTPGPIGINMATYVGFSVGGITGGILATLGEVAPAIIIILIIASFLTKFRENKYVDSAFYGLRPASTGLIGSAGLSIVIEVMFSGTGTLGIKWKAVILALIIWFLSNKFKYTKNWHPICFIGICAVVGIVLGF
ncbi:MAG: chromate transporter [Lachnospiraceae bacterium]|nr:chromate transporter [Lachnospiraceae bacterium]